MLLLENWRHLEPFGIEMLTGEGQSIFGAIDQLVAKPRT